MGSRPLKMIRRDNPGPIRFTFHARGYPTHGLETAYMRLCKTGACVRVMLKMDVNAVPPAIGGRDFRDGTISCARLGGLRLDTHDSALGDRVCSLPLADVDVVAA